MAKSKTIENDNIVEAYIAAIKEERKREDCKTIMKIMHKATGLDAKMWGPAIVGFGSYHYKYESGREGDAPLVGFAARASSIALYIGMSPEKREELLAKLGRHKTEKGCINIKKMADVDALVLKEMVENGFEHMKKHHSNNSQ